jgi:hypothetical protein
MVTTLSIIGIVVLLVLLVISAKRQRDMRVAQKQADASAHTGKAEAQHEESLLRRARVRAAHAERVRTTAPDADAPTAGSDADH